MEENDDKNALDILEEVENLSGKAIESRLRDNNKNEKLASLLKWALSFDFKFHVKKWPKISTEGNGVDINTFCTLLYKLNTRKITGQNAIDNVIDTLSKCTKLQQKWYSRVLKKDLRCGFSASTAIKAGFDIKEFKVMLATDGKKSKKLDELISNGLYCSPKLDGYRCIAVCSPSSVTLYSRKGKEYSNFPSVTKSLLEYCKNTEKSFVLDGEIMSDDFSSMQKTAFSIKSKKSVGDVSYHVFDYIPIQEWVSKSFKLTKSERLNLLENHIPFADNIQMVEHFYSNNKDEILKKEREYLSNSLEGVMAIPDIPYYLGRKSNSLIKFKTFLSQDCRVEDVIEGKGRLENKMGKLLIEQENGIFCEVGSGFTDEDRDYIWTYPSNFINKILEVQYQELTDDGVMRFPTFVRWREDK